MKKKQVVWLMVLALLMSAAWPLGPVRVSAGEEPVIHRLEGFQHLMELLEESAEKQRVVMPEIMMEMDERGALTPSEEASGISDGSQYGDYSVTNVQVAGVDEGDLVKTDGLYLYRVQPDHIAILLVDEQEKMQLVSRILLSDAMTPEEIYLDENRLVVIGRGWNLRTPNDPILYDRRVTDTTQEEMISSVPAVDEYMPVPWWEPAVTVVNIFDVSEPALPLLVRELALEGDLLSTRKVGDYLYLVSNRWINHYGIRGQYFDQAEDFLQPVYRDSALENKDLQRISYENVGYFPGAVGSNYLTIMGLSIHDENEPASVEVLLGSGHNVYASPRNMYIAVQRWDSPPDSPRPAPRDRGSDHERTDIYQFRMAEGSVEPSAAGQVPGRILNQFSMDEYQDTFRIATTTGSMWRTDEGTSKNHLYVLDADLALMGSIENIAPTERIYSVRFMGDRAYMVTFREIDPFYVIDLKEPENPEILGYLKIPGYSDYLHPYDDNHILGFGKEVYDVKGNAIPGGFKMALFDVANVTHPVEKFKLEIGDTGTDSPLLRDHKALLFHKERNLIAFPLTVMTRRSGNIDNPWQWGEFTFQGAHIYGLDLHQGFEQKIAITHLTPEDYLKAGSHWYNSQKNVDRILYVGDSLITTSNHLVQRHHQADYRLMDQVYLQTVPAEKTP